ncbi:MAG: hypothetical protein ABSC48_13290 [Terracidiphilus sp.]|jgi:uncharacterized membrane protein
MSASNPTPLSENAIGAIAYLTPFPAIAFLVLVPYKKSSFVRFHAWQSLFLTFVAVILTYLLDLGFESTGMLGARLFVPVTALILFFWLFVWILCVLRAVNGKRFKLPVIGTLAEKQAEG